MSFYSSASYSTSGATDSNGDPDLLYYNAQIINNKSNTPATYNDDPPAIFSDIRSKPLINNVSNFDFSIMRFDMNGSGKKLPLFIPEIETQQSLNPLFNINQTVYTVGATVNFNYNDKTTSSSALKTIYQSINVGFIPENMNAPKPNKPNYPFGNQFIDTIIPQNGLSYTYNNKSYKCVLNPPVVDAFSNRFDSSKTYYKGDIIYNGTTLGYSLIDNNTNVIPTSTNSYWSVIILFDPNYDPTSNSPPYALNNYVYHNLQTITVLPQFINMTVNSWDQNTSSQVGDVVLYNNNVYECIRFVAQYNKTQDYSGVNQVLYNGNLYSSKNIPVYFSNTASYLPTNTVNYLGDIYTAVSSFPAYWDATKTYAATTAVSYNGNVYTSIAGANKNELPTNATYWTFVGSYVPSVGSIYWTKGAGLSPSNTDYWTNIDSGNPTQTLLFSFLGIYAEIIQYNETYKNILSIPNYYQTGSTYGNNAFVSYQGSIYQNKTGGNLSASPPNNNWTLVDNYQLKNTKYWSKINVYLSPDLDQVDYSYNIPPKTITQDLNTNYYYISSYESFVYMINQVLDTLWDNLSKAVQTFLAANSLTTVWYDTKYVAPYFTYNSSNGLFSLVGEQKYFIRGGVDTAVSTPVGWQYTSYPIDSTKDLHTAPTGNYIPTFQFFMNENLWNLFASFQAIRISNNYLNNLTYNDVPNNLYNYPTMYYIPIYDKSDNSYKPPTILCESSLPAMFQMVQDYPTTSTLLSPVASIVFCSTLPLFSEEASVPQLYDNNSGPSGYIASSNAPFINAITDISVPLSSAQDYRGFVNYVPSGEYRMIATTGQGSAISNIELQVFWRNRLDGKLYPIRLSNFSNINIKMLFRRKGHYSK